MKKLLFLLIIFTTNAFSAPIKEYITSNYSLSEEKNKKLYPFVYFDLKSDTFYQKVKSKNDDNSNQYFYTRSDLNINLNLNENFSINSAFKAHKVKGFEAFNLTNTNERAFYGTAITVQDLNLSFNFDRVKIYLGKFDAKFGAGSERWSDYFFDSWYGINGTAFNQKYTLQEKIGIKIDALLNESESSKVNVEISAFANDNTILFRKPFSFEREIPGFFAPSGEQRLAGGTSSVSSFSLSLQGYTQGLRARDVISFNLGFKKQASENKTNELGYTFATQYTAIFFNDFTMTSFLEYAKIKNAYALQDFNETFLTGSFALGFAGLKFGVLKNYYKMNFLEKQNENYYEYFAGFEVPKTNFGVFIAKNNYKSTENYSGFTLNIRFRIN